jgi:dienelactone hydrolase
MGFAALRILFVWLVLAIGSAPARADDVVSDYGFIRVNIDHRTVRFEMLVVKPADARGRLPVAIMNHGRPGTLIEATDQRLTQPLFRLVLEDMARRGWLGVAVSRRGYGLSDGPSQTRLGCQLDSAMSWMNADADDVQAALEAIAKRPDADPTRMISFGMSAGGGASVALSARNPPGLVAAINIDGGEHNETAPSSNRASLSISRPWEPRAGFPICGCLPRTIRSTRPSKSK